jgi:hypothetical protein
MKGTRMKTFTPELDAQCVEALQLAQSYINEGHCDYICNGLRAVMVHYPYLKEACTILSARIYNELKLGDVQCHTLYGWLRYVMDQEMVFGLRSSYMDLARMAWIDRMILDYLPENQ